MLAAAPWPDVVIPSIALFVLCGVLNVLVRPQGTDWLAWAVAWMAVLISLVLPQASVSTPAMDVVLNEHCSSMQNVAENLAKDHDLRGLFAASGEILDPAMPFRRLNIVAEMSEGRTIFLADDRGMIVAWGGVQRFFPRALRALGERRWVIDWSAREVGLVFREPIFVDGRLVGALIVCDYSRRRTDAAFGLKAPRNSMLVFGGVRSTVLFPSGAAGLDLPVAVEQEIYGHRDASLWTPLFLFAVLALVLQPIIGAVATVFGGSAFIFFHGFEAGTGLALVVLLFGALIGRLALRASANWARALIGFGFVASIVVSVGFLGSDVGGWLPQRLLRPGWGGVWMVMAAWMASGWPGRKWSLGRRIAVGCLIASIGLILTVGRLPGELRRAGNDLAPLEYPDGDLNIDEILPVVSGVCGLDDFASAVAQKWQLGGANPPCELRLVDPDGLILSRWGDLAVAGVNTRLEHEWQLNVLDEGMRLELLVATEPFSMLRDWHSIISDRGFRNSPVGYAVLTRSGEVEASLVGGLGELDPIQAGRLFHENGGWVVLRSGDTRHLAWVVRVGDRLLALISLQVQLSELVIRSAISVLWVMLGLFVARPPRFERGQSATFGGRLRLLVGGGVVFPLVILTLLLQMRFVSEEERREYAAGSEALHAARYTADHLSGGFVVDDELARWIAAGLGGEIALFDHIDAVAVSRRDLMLTGVLPELPPEDAFTSLLLGHESIVVRRYGEHLITAGAVEVQGRRLLLVLSRPEPHEDVRAPGIVDWLLCGSALSALLALVLTSRVEKRLSFSLRELVAISRRLVRGDPLPMIRQPKETDLAEVLDAVSTMYSAVQKREASMRRQEELLNVALSTLASAVMVLDRSNQVRFANPSADVIRQENEAVVFDQIAILVTRCLEGKGAVVETVSPLPGRDLTWRIGVAQTPLPEGSSGFVVVIDDVTEVVRVDRLRQLNQMARIVAHEVKNPLTPIRLWVQEIVEVRSRGDQDIGDLLDEACAEISVQVKRLQEMANSFSNLAALDRWEPSRVDLVALVGDVVGGLQILGRRGVDLQLDLPELKSAVIVGDLQWLRRALGNVIMNCVAAIGEGTGEVRIRVAFEQSKLVLEISDSGGGVPEERLEDLFSPHFSTTSSGSGLGLALVHNVVSRCQGEVFAANGTHGLVIRLSFPRQAEDC